MFLPSTSYIFHTFGHPILMKKSEHLPDFHKLCSPGQNHIAFLISQQIYFFFLGAVGGFLWEVLIYLVLDGTLVKRGFLYGPWLPLYGTGAVLFYMLLGNPVHQAKYYLEGETLYSPASTISFRKKRFLAAKKERRENLHPITLFFLSLFIGTVTELASGWFLDTFWDLHYWDYSGCPLNFHGYVCLYSALGFGIAGTIWICFLSSFMTRLWIQLPVELRKRINTIFILLFLIDCAAALIFPNIGKNITFSTFDL